MIQLDNKRVVTKYISEINFVSSAKQGDIIELGLIPTQFGRTSITLQCVVRNKMTRMTILEVDKITFVNLDAEGKPAPHGKTKIEYVKDRFEGKIEGELPN